jgi:outer membrane protein OmpA-like peptidoglycan-associated protein
MDRRYGVLFTGLTIGLSTVVALAQPRPAAIASSDVLSQISMFSYRDGPRSELLFRGTPVAATAQGKGTVEYQNGNASISVKVEDLPEPASLGPYTTYVLWAITPDGRAVNQGVLAGIEGGKGELETSYSASQFALVATAEPHFAVTVPSTMIAIYNVADDVEGEESKVTTLTSSADYSELPRIAVDDDTNPLELVQARYAVAIAGAAGAQQFAPEQYANANQKLAAAVSSVDGKRKEREAGTDSAREAVIAGEDARRAAEEASALATAAEAERAKSEVASAAAAEVAARESAAAAAVAARAALLQRLNAALPTRETDRGLVSEIGGVQFATGTANLSPAAREGLSRFSGVVASYPGLQFEIEGHTDNTGSETTNNELSLRRAITVRDYLIGQRVPASAIDVEGFGSRMPVADNTSADGRARNRRVEIVLSGGPLTTTTTVR